MDSIRPISHDQQTSRPDNSTAASVQSDSSPSNNTQSAPPEIFKLPQDCFDKILDWLSLKCLDNLGQTCRHIQLIVDDYFKRNLLTIQCEIKESGMLLNCHRRCYECNTFTSLIQNVLFRQNRWEKDLHKFNYAAANCKSIRKIECEYNKLGDSALECLRPILQNLETMQINRCTITEKFRGGFPVACPNLKRLCIINGNWQLENVWLKHRYPKLVHLDWKDTLQYNELKRFFELNPSIRSFRSNLPRFWANRYQFLMANVKLNDLTIDLNIRLPTDVVDLLNEFHSFGIYNRLHLNIESIDQSYINALKSLHALDSLGFHSIRDIDLSQLTQIKELSNDLYINRRITNMTEVAIALVNLERVNWNIAATEEFFPFLFHTPKLKMMRIYNVSDKNAFDCILDLSALNREREKLSGACKVTIYIDEEVYLATKWVTNKMDSSLIEIRRVDGCSWDDQLISEYEQETIHQKVIVKSPIFKLDIDCFGEIFDYLSFKGLNSIAQTCKPLNLVAGDYFLQNFCSLKLDDRKCQRMKLLNFDQSIKRVWLFSGKLEAFRYVAANCHESITEICFDGIRLVHNQIELIGEILSKIQRVKMKNCRVSQRFYEAFPRMCAELRRLDVVDTRIRPRAIKRTGNEWLLQKYPKLEHLGWEYQRGNDYKIAEIATFFERNPNIRSFSTNHCCLWATRELIMESNVKLINLTVKINVINCRNIEQIFDLLDDLYVKGVYKRLKLKLKHHEPHHINRMASLHALTGLKIERFSRDVLLSPLTNLRELTLDESFYYTNGKLIAMTKADTVATALVNLEQLHFKKTLLGDIFSFAHHSFQLKKMKIDYIFFKEDFECILDLPAMNKEREKLFEARKLTLFVEEKVYLATKWTHYDIDLKMIEMKRIESYE